MPGLNPKTPLASIATNFRDRFGTPGTGDASPLTADASANVSTGTNVANVSTGTNVASVSTGTNVAAPTVIPPRVGGVQGGIAFTGGSNSQAYVRRRPTSVLCYRPTEYKEMRKQHTDLQTPLADKFQLDVGDESKSTVKLTQWIGELRRLIEQRGLDPVFRVASSLNPGSAETYLLAEWGKLTLAQVQTFVTLLQRGGDEYDRENLEFSGEVIRKSMGPELFNRVTAFAEPTASGPELFRIAVDQVTCMSDAVVRTLSNQLEKLDLSKVPGENVSELSKDISEIAKKIEASGKPPDDLMSLIISPYTEALASDD